MHNTDCPGTKDDIGFRFLLFRKAIKRTQLQLASELGIGQSRLAAVEKGRIFPEINYLHYLKKKYGLNINWLLCKDREMFVSKHDRPSEVDTDYAMKPQVRDGDPGYKEYLELIQLMQVPVIEKVVMESLQEVKEQMRKKAGKE
jgi:transcriptional regulator with XRE-family HTH domain